MCLTKSDSKLSFYMMKKKKVHEVNLDLNTHNLDYLTCFVQVFS